MRDSAEQFPPADTPEEARARELVQLLGFCGHYLHFHGGGRGGQGPVVCLLAKNGGKMSQQELGMHFELKPGSLSEVLSKIEAEGLIARTRNPQDRRQLFVELTDAGVAYAAREQEKRTRFRRCGFSCLTDEEQALLLDMLTRVRSRWEELDD